MNACSKFGSNGTVEILHMWPSLAYIEYKQATQHACPCLDDFKKTSLMCFSSGNGSLFTAIYFLSRAFCLMISSAS